MGIASSGPIRGKCKGFSARAVVARVGVVEPNREEQALNSQSVGLNQVRCLELRKLMHELSNVTTGMLFSSGLLMQLLAGDERCHYCEQINQAGERTATLVREMRALLHPEEQF